MGVSLVVEPVDGGSLEQGEGKAVGIPRVRAAADGELDCRSCGNCPQSRVLGT